MTQPVLAADGVHITTVEGIGSVKKNLNGANSTLTSTRSSNDDNMHPIQKAMVDFHGSQCGKLVCVLVIVHHFLWSKIITFFELVILMTYSPPFHYVPLSFIHHELRTTLHLKSCTHNV